MQRLTAANHVTSMHWSPQADPPAGSRGLPPSFAFGLAVLRSTGGCQVPCVACRGSPDLEDDQRFPPAAKSRRSSHFLRRPRSTKVPSYGSTHSATVLNQRSLHRCIPHRLDRPPMGARIGQVRNAVEEQVDPSRQKGARGGK